MSWSGFLHGLGKIAMVAAPFIPGGALVDAGIAAAGGLMSGAGAPGAAQAGINAYTTSKAAGQSAADSAQAREYAKQAAGLETANAARANDTWNSLAPLRSAYLRGALGFYNPMNPFESKPMVALPAAATPAPATPTVVRNPYTTPGGPSGRISDATGILGEANHVLMGTDMKPTDPNAPWRMKE